MQHSTVLKTMPTSIRSDMLRMFNEGVDGYQPVADGLELEEETGNPEVSTRNLSMLLDGNRVITNIMLKPGRALVLFNTWEMHLALGLCLDRSVSREALTRIAVKAGYGDYYRLRIIYDAIPEDHDSQLPWTDPIPENHDSQLPWIAD